MRHLIKHTRLARAMGIADDDMLLATDGAQVRFDSGGATFQDRVDTGRVFVDGKGGGRRQPHRAPGPPPPGHGRPGDRLAAVDPVAGKIVTEADLITRGFTLEAEGAPLWTRPARSSRKFWTRPSPDPAQDWLGGSRPR